MKRVIVVAFLVLALLTVSGCGCEDPAKNMSFYEAMDQYEWDRAEVRDYFFDEYGKHDILEMCLDKYSRGDVLAWIVEQVEFEYVLDAVYDVYSDRTAEDVILDAVADRFSISEFVEHS